MRKLFLLAAAFIGVAMVSCKKTADTPTTEPTDFSPRLSEATYYGAKLSTTAEVGYYSIIFSDANDANKTLRLDLFGSLVNEGSTPQLLAGTYNFGSKDEPTDKTFFAATSAEDTEGTIYNTGTETMLVTGGTVTVQVGTSSTYTINMNLTLGDESVEWKFSGRLTFNDERVDVPREPIVATNYGIYYNGSYNLANEPLGLIMLVLGDEVNHPNERLQVIITIPMPEDTNKAEIPVGTFEVVDQATGPYQILSGMTTPETPTMEAYVEANMATRGVMIDGGSATITKNADGTYNISTNLAGLKFSLVGGKPEYSAHVDGVVYTIDNVEFPEYPNDVTKPSSSLEGDVTLAEMPNVFVDWTYTDTNYTNKLWRLIFSTEGVTIEKAPDFDQTGTVQMVGDTDGSILGIQITVPADVETIPTGKFSVDNNYGVITANTTLPAQIGVTNALGAYAGTWYNEVGMKDGVFSALKGAGAIAGDGEVVITNTDGNNYTVEVTLYDKYGYSITGTINTTITF